MISNIFSPVTAAYGMHRKKLEEQYTEKNPKMCPMGLTLISNRQACIAEHLVKSATTCIENLI